jgi:hypothetical protein
MQLNFSKGNRNIASRAPGLSPGLSGVGGSGSFGDKPKAQAAIQQGIAYAHCRGYR